MRFLVKSLWLALSIAVHWSPAAANSSRHTAVVGEPIAKGEFKRMREPSGVIALDNETLIVIEDEASRALWRLRLSSDGSSNPIFEEFVQPPAKGFIARLRLAPLDDLEGIARISSNQFFIIGSHENASRGAHPAREKIALLTRDGSDIVRAEMRRDLFDQISRQYPELAELVKGSKKGKNRAMNIEALAFDRKRHKLLIGLRTPLINNSAIVISLANPIDYIEGSAPKFTDPLITIDLNGDGIRAMAYDDHTDKLIIVSKKESGGKNRSTLWSLAATLDEDATSYRSDDKNLFKDVEGLTPIAEGVLFVRDGGGATNKKGDDHWFILKREQLGL